MSSNTLRIAATYSSCSAIISRVLSPATEPTTCSSFRQSMASAAAFPQPESVFTTMRFCAEA